MSCGHGEGSEGSRVAEWRCTCSVSSVIRLGWGLISVVNLNIIESHWQPSEPETRLCNPPSRGGPGNSEQTLPTVGAADLEPLQRGRDVPFPAAVWVTVMIEDVWETLTYPSHLAHVMLTLERVVICPRWLCYLATKLELESECAGTVTF